MKPLFTKHLSRRGKSESGNFVIIMAAAFFAFLMIAGWATDSANLFRTKLALQRAVDAGVLAGTAKLSEGVTTTQAALQNAAGDIARSVAIANANQSGILPYAQIDSPTVTSQSVTLNGRVNAPLLFLRMVPWMHNTQVVSSDATASMSQSHAIVSLILDTTGSMACPSVGSCSPNPCNTHGDCGGGVVSKLRKLQVAAVSFVNKFSESRDQIALVSMSLGDAQVNKPMAAPFVKSSLIHTITHDLSASGETNIEQGIFLGKEELSHANSVTGTVRRFVVLLSDGAPNQSNHASVGAPNPCRNHEMASDDPREHYLRAIQMADQARNVGNTGATFYTVGLGDSPQNVLLTDPYEFIGDINSVKPRLLRRLTNDASARNDPSFDCVQDYAHYNDGTANRAIGQYFTSPTADELQGALDSIANSIFVKAHLTN